MGEFLRIAFFMIALVVALPVGAYVLSGSGYNADFGDGANMIDDYAFPNLESYAPQPSDNAIDATIKFASMALTSIVWMGSIVIKTIGLFPVLVGLFHVPPVLATAMSALIFVLGMVFIFILWRGRAYT